jgi:dTDP-glucose 4,6-dehydratase
VTISRSGNNFGPYQNQEKLIPSMTIKALAGEDLTLYGDGKNKRDWLFVRDHSIAIMKILKRRAFGEIYHIGSGYERTNIEVCEAICEEIFRQTGKRSESKITFIQDRKGHDRRYSLEVKKTQEILDFSPKVAFNEGIKYVVSSLLHKSQL